MALVEERIEQRVDQRLCRDLHRVGFGVERHLDIPVGEESIDQRSNQRHVRHHHLLVDLQRRNAVLDRVLERDGIVIVGRFDPQARILRQQGVDDLGQVHFELRLADIGQVLLVDGEIDLAVLGVIGNRIDRQHLQRLGIGEFDLGAKRRAGIHVEPEHVAVTRADRPVVLEIEIGEAAAIHHPHELVGQTGDGGNGHDKSGEKELITLNPGSLSYPRQEGRQPSYAIMEIDREGKVHFTIAYLRQ